MSVKFQGDTLIFCEFIQVFVFTTNHPLKISNVLKRLLSIPTFHFPPDTYMVTTPEYPEHNYPNYMYVNVIDCTDRKNVRNFMHETCKYQPILKIG